MSYGFLEFKIKPNFGGAFESNTSDGEIYNGAEITQLLKETNGVIVKDDILNLDYPMPLYSKNKDEVFVGRIRKDFSHEKAINLTFLIELEPLV